MANSSSISEFLLLALADTRQLQLLHFWLLLGIYLAALLGNGLISTAVACDHRLHTPMYFFLLNLALLDLGCISTTLGRHKGFSTCLPHLVVLSLFVSTAMFAYLKPHSISSPPVDLVVAVLYAVVPPVMNPLIYSMRNKELKVALNPERPTHGQVDICFRMTQ
eukprot:XP_025001120.1 olfactory receptor 14I1-like [Gallus gallus]